MPKMSAEQRHYLQGRVRVARRKQELPYDHDPKMPPDVRAAQQKVARWKRAKEAERDSHNAAISKREIVVDEAIYSGDYARALEMVKRFEAGRA